jgi:hypothetical protein
MTKEPTNHSLSSMELEILALLMEPKEEIYPWDTTTLAAEAYFSEAEQQLNSHPWLEQELIATTPGFLSQLDNLWQTKAPVQPAQSLQAKLSAQFAQYVPQKWLATISRQASNLIDSQKSLNAQLVQCIQELVPNCLEEDLLVLARPYANPMRSNLDSAIVQLNITPEQWTTLSEIQQAKIGLAIAFYALETIQDEENI